MFLSLPLLFQGLVIFSPCLHFLRCQNWRQGNKKKPSPFSIALFVDCVFLLTPQ